MNVLYVTFRESLNGGASKGVMETQVRDVLTRLSSSAAITWLALTQDEAIGPAPAEEWIVHRRLKKGAGGLLSRSQAVGYLRSEVDRLHPDIVHARGYSATLIALLAARGRVPVIFDPRGLLPLERVAYDGAGAQSPRTRAWLFLERWLARHANAIVAVSPPMAQYFHKLAPHTRVVRIPLTVDTLRFDAARKEGKRLALRQALGVSEDQLLLVYSGSLRPVGEGFLEAMVSRVTAGTCRASVLLLSRDGLAEMDPRLSSHTNVIIRKAAYEDMPGYLDASDWGLVARKPASTHLLNQIELTTKVPEYLAAGLPIMVNATSTYLATLVRERGLGLAVDPTVNDPIHLDDWPQAQRDSLRTHARQHFSLDAVTGAYLELYEDLRLRVHA